MTRGREGGREREDGSRNFSISRYRPAVSSTTVTPGEPPSGRQREANPLVIVATYDTLARARLIYLERSLIALLGIKQCLFLYIMDIEKEREGGVDLRQIFLWHRL